MCRRESHLSQEPIQAAACQALCDNGSQPNPEGWHGATEYDRGMFPHARKVFCTKACVQRDGAELDNSWGGDGHGLHHSQPDLDARG